MKKIIAIILIILVAIVAVSLVAKYYLKRKNTESPVYAGRTYCEKEGIFSINIPEGWEWVRKCDESGIDIPDITLVDKEKYNHIKIVFGPANPAWNELSDKNKKEILRIGTKSAMEDIIGGGFDVTITYEYAREIGGVDAYQLNFIWRSEAGKENIAMVTFVKGGYIFSVYFNLFPEEERLERERIIQTLSVPAKDCDWEEIPPEPFIVPYEE